MNIGMSKLSIMKKIILITILAVSLGACSNEQLYDLSDRVNHVCIDGVRYIIVSYGMSVAYNQDGTIKTCVTQSEAN